MNYTISKENILAISEFGNEAKAYLMKQFPEVFWKEGDYVVYSDNPQSYLLVVDSIISNTRFKAKEEMDEFSDYFYPSIGTFKLEDFRLATEEEIKRFIPDYVKQDETPLEKAKRLYKKGTKFGLSHSFVHYRIFTDPIFDTDENGIFILNDDSFPYVFFHNQWAEIIEQ